ncbi:hypothetical protein ACLB2K_029603 [Fragaria x ananassa]
MWDNVTAATSNIKLPCVFRNHSWPNDATEVGPGPSYIRTGTLGWPRLSWSCGILAGDVLLQCRRETCYCRVDERRTISRETCYCRVDRRRATVMSTGDVLLPCRPETCYCHVDRRRATTVSTGDVLLSCRRETCHCRVDRRRATTVSMQDMPLPC